MTTPVRHLALVDDYDVVLAGVAHLLDGYPDRVVIAEIDANKPSRTSSTSCCTTRSPSPSPTRPRSPCSSTTRGPARSSSTPGTSSRSWSTAPAGWASAATSPRPSAPATWWPPSRPSTPASSSSATPPPRPGSALGLDWPGRTEGLTDRESEILALITQGKSNAEVASLTFLSPNTVKSHIRAPTARSAPRAVRRRCCGASSTASARPPPHRPLARRPLTARLHNGAGGDSGCVARFRARGTLRDTPSDTPQLAQGGAETGRRHHRRPANAPAPTAVSLRGRRPATGNPRRSPGWRTPRRAGRWAGRAAARRRFPRPRRGRPRPGRWAGRSSGCRARPAR